MPGQTGGLNVGLFAYRKSMKMKKMCLNCRFYRLIDLASGRCRVDREQLVAADLPITLHEYCCDRWRDAGQHYHIRRGWLRSQAAKDHA